MWDYFVEFLRTNPVGLLFAVLGLGYLRALHPTFGRVPEAARWIFMAGAVVTSVPVLVGYLFGRKVLSLNPVFLLGGITGSMTSGASLSIVTGEARSSLPALGYTGAYAFANVLLTVAGSLILLL